MGCDIAVVNNEGDEIIEMNWLRNPFGLCTWAEDNVGEGDNALWHIINDDAYDASSNVNKEYFKLIVDRYWARLQQRSEGFFFFDFTGYRQFVEGRVKFMKTEKYFGHNSIVGEEYINTPKGKKLKIPQWQFHHCEFVLSKCTFEDYKVWFAELVKFAELLQNPDYQYYCSN